MECLCSNHKKWWEYRIWNHIRHTSECWSLISGGYNENENGQNCGGRDNHSPTIMEHKRSEIMDGYIDDITTSKKILIKRKIWSYTNRIEHKKNINYCYMKLKQKWSRAQVKK